MCAGAYEACRERMGELIRDSAGGRELRQRGFERDVRLCARTDVSRAVPVLRDGRFVNANGDGAR